MIWIAFLMGAATIALLLYIAFRQEAVLCGLAQDISVLLLHIQAMHPKIDRIMYDDLANLRGGMTSMEETLAGVNSWLDRLETRVERLERRHVYATSRR
jgi:hypothetical protein